jgi:hypothetical protein
MLVKIKKVNNTPLNNREDEKPYKMASSSPVI